VVYILASNCYLNTNFGIWYHIVGNLHYADVYSVRKHEDSTVSAGSSLIIYIFTLCHKNIQHHMTCEYVLVYASTLATFYLYTVVKNYYMSTGVVKFITNITDFSDLEP
jgi:hypothetical protein